MTTLLLFFFILKCFIFAVHRFIARRYGGYKQISLRSALRVADTTFVTGF